MLTVRSFGLLRTPQDDRRVFLLVVKRSMKVESKPRGLGHDRGYNGADRGSDTIVIGGSLGFGPQGFDLAEMGRSVLRPYTC